MGMELMCIYLPEDEATCPDFSPHQLGNGNNWNNSLDPNRDAEGGRDAHQPRFLYVLMEQSCPVGPGLLYKKERNSCLI